MILYLNLLSFEVIFFFLLILLIIFLSFKLLCVLGLQFLSSFSSMTTCGLCFYLLRFAELLFSKSLNISSLRLRDLGWHQTCPGKVIF